MTKEDAQTERRGRRPNPEELEKHTIMVPAALWRWARSTAGGAGRLIRALLTEAKNEDEHDYVFPGMHSPVPRRQLSVSTPAGDIVAKADDDGITLMLADEPVLQYTYDGRRKCPCIVILTRPDKRWGREEAAIGDDFSALESKKDE